MPVRLCKIGLSFITAAFLFIVVFNNITDYGSNFAFVQGVLGMSTTFEGNKLMWRAINSPIIHHLFYASIILWELTACLIVAFGTWKLWSARSAPVKTWEAAKQCTIVGHAISMMQWYFAFMTVGGEWFVMWQSDSWNGQDAATRMFLLMGISLIFIYLKDTENETA